MLKVGSILDHKYKILNEVGHGGMSVVYLAINERANKTWAIKEVRKDGVCDFEAVKQGLVVETDMLKKLSHSHLPSIIDVIDMDDSFIIVMDYIEGQSLQSVLKKEGAQPQDLVIQWGIQLCDVLGYLHNQTPSIIYRDMKPANVMLKPDGNVMLIDFGTAREFKDRAMVEDTTCLGTRGYAAPEQFGGRGQTDGRTDIYCLGATLYHLLTGHSPAEPPYEIKPLSYWDPNYAGSGLEMIINKCCQQDPAARYQTCGELMYDLQHVDEFNSVVIRSRKRKWNAFLASIGVCALGVAAAVGFQFARGSAQSTTSAYYYQSFSEATNLADKQAALNKLLKLDPAEPKYYRDMMEFVERDNELTDEEANAVMAMLSESHENALKAADPKEYAMIEFRAGRAFYLFHNGSAKNDSAIAYKYFTRAEGGLDEKQEALRSALAAVASQSEGLERNSSGQGASISGAFSDNADGTTVYQQFWNDLNAAYTAAHDLDVSQKNYTIMIYNRVAAMLDTNKVTLNANGITTDQMRQLLDDMAADMERFSTGLNTDSELKLWQASNQTIETAKSGVASINPARSAGKTN